MLKSFKRIYMEAKNDFRIWCTVSNFFYEGKGQDT